MAFVSISDADQPRGALLGINATFVGFPTVLLKSKFSKHRGKNTEKCPISHFDRAKKIEIKSFSLEILEISTSKHTCLTRIMSLWKCATRLLNISFTKTRHGVNYFEK